MREFKVHTLHRGQGLMVNIRMAVKKDYKQWVAKMLQSS